MISEFKLPELGENIASGTVVKLHVKPGDPVKKDDTLLEIEASKATIEVPSTLEGTVKEILVKEGDEAKVGQVIIKIDTAESKEEPEEKKKEPAPRAQAQEVKASGPQDIPAAPSVRRLAREKGVDISALKGSGPAGRILDQDVLAKPLPCGLILEPLPDFSKWGEVKVKPLSGIRQKTAEHLMQAWNTVPQVTQFDKADVTELEKLIKEHSTPEVKLTITPFIIKVISSALRIFPQFNASIDMSGRQLIFKKYCHVGVAVGTDRGLLVPVIRDADKKNIILLAKELQALAELARNGKLSLDQMRGGCFTVSNLGNIGGTSFAPVINWPELAILGVPRSRWEPVFDNNQFSARKILTLSLSFDHRAIDGADGCRFLRWVAEALQQPFLLEMEG